MLSGAKKNNISYWKPCIYNIPQFGAVYGCTVFFFIFVLHPVYLRQILWTNIIKKQIFQSNSKYNGILGIDYCQLLQNVQLNRQNTFLLQMNGVT